MGYRIPSKARLLEAIERVLDEAGGVRSQAMLTDLVRDLLHDEDPKYRVSEERVRRIALESPRVRVSITARRSDEDRPLVACPVCGGKLRQRHNATLTGGRVPLETKCERCPYWTGADRRVPMRYAFHIRSWFGTDPRSRRKSGRAPND